MNVEFQGLLPAVSIEAGGRGSAPYRNFVSGTFGTIASPSADPRVLNDKTKRAKRPSSPLGIIYQNISVSDNVGCRVDSSGVNVMSLITEVKFCVASLALPRGQPTVTFSLPLFFPR